MIVIVVAAAALASFLRAKGDSHRLGGATDLAGSLEAVRSEFNRQADHPRLVMILAPACPVCLEGARTVAEDVLPANRDLVTLAVWMEALPFDITRNPARRVESFSDQPRMIHFYDMNQVSGRAAREILDWQDDSLPWDLFLLYPPHVLWREDLPPPRAWFHQRQEANELHYRTGADLTDALLAAIGSV